jgi:hypothetical protein
LTHYKNLIMKTKIFLIVLTVISIPALSQEWRLNAYGAYVFDDAFDSYFSPTSYYSGRIQGGFLWGAGLEYRVHQAYGIELYYQRQDTKAPTDYWDFNENRARHTNFDLGINYIMLAGARSLHASNNIEPYGGFMAGVGILNATNPDNNVKRNATKFAWGLRLGTNIWTVTQKVGLKLQVQLLSVAQGAGGGFYFGTGGAGAGISTYSTMYQFAIGGGFTFKLGQHGSSSSSGRR